MNKDKIVNRTVLTVGVFDLLHWGHFELFRRAKELAGEDGKLTVAVQEDAIVTKYKPQTKLVYDWDKRVKMIGALRYVDKVVPYTDIDESIKHIDFDVFAIGGDQVHAGFQRAVKWCEEKGKDIIVMPRTEGISTTLLKQYSSTKPYHVGITVGVFDLFHVGHLNLLERCKAMCDYLIVAVCGDDYVTQIKKKTPVYPEEQRRRILGALSCVDEVIPVSIEETEDKMLLIKNHPFDVLFSGDDWKGSRRYLKTEEQFAAYGAKIEYLPYTNGISTTDIKAIVKTS